jgi:predicted phage-related endonuclease
MSRYLVCEHPQGTPEWHQDRLGKVTGSNAAAVLATVKSGEAATRANYRTQLVLERITKTAQGIDYVSPEMKWGTEQEPFARMAYEGRKDIDVLQSGFLYLPNLAAGCSLDGMFYEGNKTGIFEAKCPKSATHWGYLKANEVPSVYVPQVEHNLWITGADFCDFVSFDPRMPEALQLFVVRYHRDQKRIDAHAAAVMQFLKEVDRDERDMLDMIARLSHDEFSIITD